MSTPQEPTCPNTARPAKDRFHDLTLVYCVFCRATNPTLLADNSGNPAALAAPQLEASRPPPASQASLAIGVSSLHPASSLPGITTAPLLSSIPLASMLPSSTQPSLSSLQHPSNFAGNTVMRTDRGNEYAGQGAQNAANLRLGRNFAQSQPAHAGSPLPSTVPAAPTRGLPSLVQGRGQLIGGKPVKLWLAVRRFHYLSIMHLNYFIKIDISIKLVSKCLLTLLNSYTSFNLCFFIRELKFLI